MEKAMGERLAFTRYRETAEDDDEHFTFGLEALVHLSDPIG
jgi:hypothetical protein